MIRFQRVGRKNVPHFRAVVTDKRNAAKAGKFLEVVGSYNPKAGEVTLDKERITHWIGKGAQPSDTMHNFLVDQGIMKGKKINVLSKTAMEKNKKQEVKEELKAETPKAEEPKEEKKEEASAETPAEEPKTEETPA